MALKSKATEENHKGKSYVTKAFKKYLPFIFIENNALKINFKNKVLLVVPKIWNFTVNGTVNIAEYF